jgi:hypothetical protein
MTNLESIDRDGLLDEIKRLLPDPFREDAQLDGDVVLVGGDPGDVIVRVGRSKVSIAVYSVRWEGPHTPVVRPKQIATLNWKRLPASRTMMELHNLIESAVEIRRSKYGKCVRCGETNPPEWMHDENTCQSCAERYSGVVH